MPWMVAAIGILCFAAGVSFGTLRFLVGSLFIAGAAAVAFLLRWYTITTINQAFDQGAGYGISTRYRLRNLPQAHQAPATLKHKPVDPPL